MKNITVKPNITIRQAMKKLSQSGEKCLVIIDLNKKLLGTLSDGDLRKGILKGYEMNHSIEQIYQSNPTVFIDGEYTDENVKRIFAQQRFDLIPVINKKGKLIKILLWDEILKNNKKNKKETQKKKTK